MFNPPHWGHFLLAEQVLERCSELDEIWFMPAYKHHWKKTITSPDERYDMTKLLAGDTFAVSREEMGLKDGSFTIETMRALRKKHPHKFYWIIGSDIVPQLPKWGNTKQLLKEVSFIIFPRVGFPIKTIPHGSIVVNTDVVKNNISSSEIRARVASNRSIKGLVPEDVAGYIEKNKLYKKQ